MEIYSLRIARFDSLGAGPRQIPLTIGHFPARLRCYKEMVDPWFPFRKDQMKPLRPSETPAGAASGLRPHC